MSSPRTTAIWLALLFGGALTTAAAAGDRVVVLRAGLQADDRSGFGLDAGLDWQLADQSWLALDLGGSDAGSEFDDIRSRYAALRFAHRFENPLSVELGYEAWGDPGAVKTGTVLAGVALQGGGWRVGVDARLRDTEFTLEVRDAPADVVGDCDSSDTGLGVSVSYQGERAGVHLRRTSYDYSRTLCQVGRFRLDPFNLPPIALIRAPALERLQASAVGRTRSFFDDSLSAGIDWRFGSTVVDLQFLHDTGAFDRLDSDTLSLGLLFETRRAFDWRLRLGVTDTEGVGSTAYASVGFWWYR